MMGSHPTWCLVVTLSVLCSGTKVQPRQVVYQIRPAPLSAFTSQDGTFLLEDGVTEFQFPSFGLKTHPQQVKSVKVYPTDIVTSPASLPNDSGDIDSSSSSSSSSSPSEESSSSGAKEDITEVPKFDTSQLKHVQVGPQQFLQLQPEQIQRIFQQIQQPQQVQIAQQQLPVQEPTAQQQLIQNGDIGPPYGFRSDESKGDTEDIKTAQSEVITEDKLQPAYSERREKRKRKEPPGDASYAFGYETDEAARHEVADQDGNVKGWYTYVDDEGTVRKIIYTAGAGKGFVVLGKEKVRGPKGQSSPSQSRKYNNGPSRSSRSDYLGFASDNSAITSVKHQKPPSTPAPFTNYVSFGSWNDLAKAGTSNPPIPTTIIATAEPPPRTKKPVFIVKIRRPVTKEQFHNAKPFTDPEPLPVPITTKTRTRRRGTMTLSDVVPPSLRKSRIKKYPTPPIYYADDDDESGDETSSSTSSIQASGSSSSSGEYDNSDNESRERGGGGGGAGRIVNRGGGGGLPVKSDPDSSYVFGYETEHSNRLEKADPYGNVRGSYSYIGGSLNQLLSRHHSPYSSASHHHHRPHVVDEPMKRAILLKRGPRKSKKSTLKSFIDPEGVKRTVHYIAGGNTGFQVIHASPSISRGVRLEAPPGYVVKRVPSLRTSESRYPIPITVPQPSAIVYHIHPDSGWKPWEPTLRKKKVKIHRKKLPKAIFENARRDGIVLLQTHPDPPIVPQKTVQTFIDAPKPNPISNNGVTTLGVSAGNPATGTYFKEKITAAGSGAVTATEVKLPPYNPNPPPIPSRRRHAPQRGYTAEHHFVQIDDDDSKERIAATAYLSSSHNHNHKHSKSSSSSGSSSSSKSQTSQSQSNNQVHEREPLLYSPTFETMRDSRMPIPNPIQLQPTQVAIKNRGAPTQTATGAPGLDTSSSNHHPVAFSSNGKLQVDVPTVIIEAIEAKSPSLSQHQLQKDENRNALLHKLPEAAALNGVKQQQQQQLAGSNNNYIQTPTPISPGITYQLSSISAPTAPATSSTSTPSIPQQKTAQTAPVNNQIISTTQSQPVQRSRRRHHRSKSGAVSGTTPTPTSGSASSTSGGGSSSLNNALKNGEGSANLKAESSTTMTSSKRLINRLAPTDHDETLTAQQ